MTRLTVIAALAFWAGATLVLSRHRWFARRSLADRLRPYEPGGLATAAGGHGMLSVDSFAEVIAPLARTVGEQLHPATEARKRRVERHARPELGRHRRLGVDPGGAAPIAGAVG